MYRFGTKKTKQEGSKEKRKIVQIWYGTELRCYKNSVDRKKKYRPNICVGSITSEQTTCVVPEKSTIFHRRRNLQQ
jgi:hypothetical protein